MSVDLEYQPPGKAYAFWDMEERKKAQEFLTETFWQQSGLTNFLYTKSSSLDSFDGNGTLLMFRLGSLGLNDMFISYLGIGTFAGRKRFDEILQYHAIGNQHLDLMDNPGQILNQPVLVVSKEGHYEISYTHLDNNWRFMPFTPEESHSIASKILEGWTQQPTRTTDDLDDVHYHGVISGKITLFELRAHLITDLRIIKRFLEHLEEIIAEK